MMLRIVSKRQSANEEKLYSGLIRNELEIDVTSSAFVVIAANNGMAEVQIAKLMEQNESLEYIMRFATARYRDL